MTEEFESVAERASSVRARDAETPVVLAADVGSSNVRAALFDAREASCRAAALLALERLGALRSLTDAPAPTYETFAPDAEAHARYREALARQQSPYESAIRHS